MEEQKEIVKAAPKKSIIKIDDSGKMKPQNIEELTRVAQYQLSSGGLAPQHKTVAGVIIAFATCRELDIPELWGSRQIAIIRGQPVLFGDLPLALVLRDGHMEYYHEYFVDEKYNLICAKNKNLDATVFAAICEVKRKDDKFPLETFFTMAEAERAGLLKLKNGREGPWQQYTKRMLKYRARSQALKDKFADSLNGLGIKEYDHDGVEYAGSVEVLKTNINKSSIL